MGVKMVGDYYYYYYYFSFLILGGLCGGVVFAICETFLLSVIQGLDGTLEGVRMMDDSGFGVLVILNLHILVDNSSVCLFVTH